MEADDRLVDTICERAHTKERDSGRQEVDGTAGTDDGCGIFGKVEG